MIAPAASSGRRGMQIDVISEEVWRLVPRAGRIALETRALVSWTKISFLRDWEDQVWRREEERRRE